MVVSVAVIIMSTMYARGKRREEGRSCTQKASFFFFRSCRSVPYSPSLGDRPPEEEDVGLGLVGHVVDPALEKKVHRYLFLNAETVIWEMKVLYAKSLFMGSSAQYASATANICFRSKDEKLQKYVSDLEIFEI